MNDKKKNKNKEKNENKKQKEKYQKNSKIKNDKKKRKKINLKKIVHIYNNNRCLQKSNSAGNFCKFFEPYYSKIIKSQKQQYLQSKNSDASIQINFIKPPKTRIETDYFPPITQSSNTKQIKNNNAYSSNEDKTKFPLIDIKKLKYSQSSLLYPHNFLSRNIIDNERELKNSSNKIKANSVTLNNNKGRNNNFNEKLFFF